MNFQIIHRHGLEPGGTRSANFIFSTSDFHDFFFRETLTCQPTNEEVNRVSTPELSMDCCLFSLDWLFGKSTVTCALNSAAAFLDRKAGKGIFFRPCAKEGYWVQNETEYDNERHRNTYDIKSHRPEMGSGNGSSLPTGPRLLVQWLKDRARSDAG